MATAEKLKKRTNGGFCIFWSSSAVKRAISSYYELLLYSPPCIYEGHVKMSPPHRPLATPTSPHGASTQLAQDFSKNLPYDSLF